MLFASDSRRRGKKRRVKSSTTRAALAARIKQLSLRRSRNLPHAYTPCDHEGDCVTANCICARNLTFCEKYCACAKTCKNRSVSDGCMNVMSSCVACVACMLCQSSILV